MTEPQVSWKAIERDANVVAADGSEPSYQEPVVEPLPREGFLRRWRRRLFG